MHGGARPDRHRSSSWAASSSPPTCRCRGRSGSATGTASRPRSAAAPTIGPPSLSPLVPAGPDYVRDRRLGRRAQTSRPRSRAGTQLPPGLIGPHRAARLRVADGRPHRLGGGAAAARQHAGARRRRSPLPRAGEPAALDVAWQDSRVTITGDIEVRGLAGPPREARPHAGRLLISGVWIAGQLRRDRRRRPRSRSPTRPWCPGSGCCPTAPRCVPATRASWSRRRAPLSSWTARSADRSPPTPAGPRGSAPASSTLHRRATSPTPATDLASAGADLHVEDSTIVGKVRARTLTLASNTIFRARLGRRDPWPAAVWASRQQAGCVRFCVLPFGSITPRRYPMPAA